MRRKENLDRSRMIVEPIPEVLGDIHRTPSGIGLRGINRVSRLGKLFALGLPEITVVIVIEVLIASFLVRHVALQFLDHKLQKARLKIAERLLRILQILPLAPQLIAERVPSIIPTDLQSCRVLLHALDHIAQSATGTEHSCHHIQWRNGRIAILRLLLREQQRYPRESELLDAFRHGGQLETMPHIERVHQTVEQVVAYILVGCRVDQPQGMRDDVLKQRFALTQRDLALIAESMVIQGQQTILQPLGLLRAFGLGKLLLQHDFAGGMPIGSFVQANVSIQHLTIHLRPNPLICLQIAIDFVLHDLQRGVILMVVPEHRVREIMRDPETIATADRFTLAQRMQLAQLLRLQLHIAQRPQFIEQARHLARFARLPLAIEGSLERGQSGIDVRSRLIEHFGRSTLDHRFKQIERSQIGGSPLSGAQLLDPRDNLVGRRLVAKFS